jgi:hypothetical protein
MAIFSTCRKCGCKAVIVVLVGALAHTAVHHQDVCLREQSDGPSLYCTKYVAEPVHTNDHGPSNNGPVRSVTLSVSSTSSSPVITQSFWTVGGSGST